jgi:ATP phosphoribosyltransferase
LIPLEKLLSVTAFLIANKESLENKDLSQVLACLSSQLTAAPQTSIEEELDSSKELKVPRPSWSAKEINLALPDGHQQAPAAQFLKRVGLAIEGYCDGEIRRRPSADFDWLGIKVIRPQDMPLQVANGNFDLAITGEDWLREHLYRFPSSPVKKLFALGFGEVKIVAAISQEMPVSNTDDLRSLVQSGRFTPLKVASEYINIADKYLRDNHINPYKLIPTWGASEAFLPEDADMLIDNVQTGKTLKQHQLKIIDVLFRSSACVISNKDSLTSSDKKEKMQFLTQKLRAGLKQIKN